MLGFTGEHVCFKSCVEFKLSKIYILETIQILTNYISCEVIVQFESSQLCVIVCDKL